MVKFSILINRSPSPVGFFSSSRELRQGNPLSPYLFIIVMEALIGLMNRAVERGMMQGFWIGEDKGSTLKISHQLNADNTVVFCDARIAQLRFLRCILLCF
uniref:Reverse transcriptase domain-containing protein n=1 Tax=Davidia involucrata TaxID=16924 RepID=A0A5B7BH79_DAVIN